MRFDLAKLSSSLLNMGTQITQTAFTFSMMKDMNRQGGMMNGSIFGSGCCCGGGMMNMGMLGMGMSGIGIGGCGGGMAAQGLMAYAMMGAQDGLQMRAEVEAQKMANKSQMTIAKTKNEKASNVSENQDTKLGESFEKKTHEMVEDGKPVEDKKFGFMSEEWQKDFKDKKDIDKSTKEYKEGVSEAGKSYLMAIDKASGNKDGQLSEEEFVKYSIDKDFETLKDDATDKEKQEYKEKLEAAKYQAKIAFDKLDQNGDKSVDWKEVSAMFAALDAKNLTGGYNGEISSNDFADFSKLLAEKQGNQADKALREAYKNLYGKE